MHFSKTLRQVRTRSCRLSGAKEAWPCLRHAAVVRRLQGLEELREQEPQHWRAHEEVRGGPRSPVPTTVPTNPHGASDSGNGRRRPPKIPIEEDPKNNNDEDWLRRYHNHILVVLAFGGLCCLYVIWHFGSGLYYEHLQRLALQSSSAGRTGGSSV